MNDKIRNYVRQSRLDVYGLGAKRQPWEDAVDRFVTLLVDDVCDDMLSLEPMYPAHVVALKIREKYGIGKNWNEVDL